MKKNNMNRSLLIVVGMLASATSGWAFSTGAPGGTSGAPGEDTCVVCHTGGGLNSGAGKVTISFPDGTTYAGGRTYRMRVTLEDPTASRWGFQLSVRKEATTTAVGTFAVPATPTPAIVQILSGRYLTHSAASGSTFRAQRSQAAWEFDWTAPAAGTGAVRFYVAGNAANNNGSDSGDRIYSSNLALGEASTAPPTAITNGNTVIPQFVFGGGWTSSLYFTNSTAAPVSFPVRFYNESAAEMPFGGSAVKQMIIPSKGTAIIQAQNTGSLTQGWSTFDLPAGVVGYGVFRQAVPGIPDQEAVVPFAASSGTKASLTYDESNLVTAAAVWYNGAGNANVLVVARDEGGSQIGTTTLAMSPGTRRAFTMVSEIPAINGKRGVLEFSTPTGTIAVLGLRFAGSAFTSIPAAP